MDLLQQYKAMMKQRKIEQAPTEFYIDTTPIQYHERKHYTFTQRYKRKYHFGEVFNRILCKEKNRPENSEIQAIKEKLDNDFSMDSIYKNTTYNQRKHLIYIWHILNNIEIPMLTSKLDQERDFLLRYLNMFYSRIGTNKAIKYRLVMDVVCEQFNITSIRHLLYFKDNLKYRKKVREVLKFKEKSKSY